MSNKIQSYNFFGTIPIVKDIKQGNNKTSWFIPFWIQNATDKWWTRRTFL